MKSTYEGLTNGQAFELFNQNILLAGGVAVDQQQAAHATLDEIGIMFKPYARNYTPWEIPDHVWPEADHELRTVLIGGSLARAGWSAQRRENRPRELVYPNITKKLGEPEVAAIAADLLVATNTEHMRLCFVPHFLLPTIVKIYAVANPGQQTRILESWGATQWANQMLDSDDPHPVSTLLRDKEADDDIKAHAIDLALNEVETYGSRYKLREMLLIALEKYPGEFSTEQVKRIRRANRLPENDEDYKQHLQQVADNEAERRAKQRVFSEEIDAKGRTVLNATMASVKATLAQRWWDIQRRQSEQESNE